MADDIFQWLEDLGLGQYAPIFAKNSVELDHLPYLTEDDLRELDIPLGPRRKLQAAVKSLSANEPPAQIAPSARPDGETHAADAELRQLTVLFCDLVGSTALSAKLDPEDLREIVRAYQDACAEVVTRYEGFVAKFMGDGVLVYFGYPQSFENDAERAIHAGLGLVEAVSVLRGRMTTRWRRGLGLRRVASLLAISSAKAYRGKRRSPARPQIWRRGFRTPPRPARS